MKIFGVTLVRTEADIMATTLRYHLALGLDGVFVLDNASTDGTGKILEQLAQAGDRIHWSRHEGEFQQAELTTGLAQEACRAGADWIVPFDADEFWYAPGRAFREVLESSNAGALRAQVLHYIQAREQTRCSERALLTMTRRAPRMIGPPDKGRTLVEGQEIAYVEAMYPPKWIGRASMDLAFGAGNHSARNLTGMPETTMDLVCLHAPIRSYDTLARKAEQSGRLEAAGWPPADGWHQHRVRRLLERHSLAAEWAANSYQDDALEVYGARRPVIFDSTLRDAVAPFLTQVSGDVTDLGPSETQAHRIAWQTTVTQNFLTNLHEDALSRTEWAAGLDEQLERARERLAKLGRQVAERTAWAKALDEDLIRARKVIFDLEATVAERTAWAQAADREVARARESLRDLQSELAKRAAPPAVDRSELGAGYV